MAQVGNEKYPELSVEEAIEIADVLVNDYGGSANSEEAFAQSIGHASANSGSYYTKVADVRRFGIMPSRGLEATDLAHTLANPRNEQELAEAKYEMFQNIDILSDIYDSLNGNEPPEDFWRVISEVTSANPKEARESSEDLESLYDEMRDAKENAEESKRIDESESSTETTTEEPQPISEPISSESAIYIKVGDDELRLSEVNETYIQLAQSFLKQLDPADYTSEGEKGEEDDSGSQTKLTDN